MPAIRIIRIYRFVSKKHWVLSRRMSVLLRRFGCFLFSFFKLAHISNFILFLWFNYFLYYSPLARKTFIPTDKNFKLCSLLRRYWNKYEINLLHRIVSILSDVVGFDWASIFKVFVDNVLWYDVKILELLSQKFYSWKRFSDLLRFVDLICRYSLTLMFR